MPTPIGAGAPLIVRGAQRKPASDGAKRQAAGASPTSPADAGSGRSTVSSHYLTLLPASPTTAQVAKPSVAPDANEAFHCRIERLRPDDEVGSRQSHCRVTDNVRLN